MGEPRNSRASPVSGLLSRRYGSVFPTPPPGRGAAPAVRLWQAAASMAASATTAARSPSMPCTRAASYAAARTSGSNQGASARIPSSMRDSRWISRIPTGDHQASGTERALEAVKPRSAFDSGVSRRYRL